MPELPEVQTTVNGLKERVIGLTITHVWTNYDSKYFHGSETIKDPAYFKHFKKEVTNKSIISVERRAKNILINLNDNKTILIHMKMTGHLLYGLYKFDKTDKNDPWKPISPLNLKDPFNKRVRFVLSLNNGKFLALSDTRKFAKVTLLNTAEAHKSEHLNKLGPEPLDKDFSLNEFVDRLNKKSKGKIKQVLVDQEVLSGIGNIYADESLWRAGVNPTRKVSSLTRNELTNLLKAIKTTLLRGIDFGGDSMSDYRNIDGDRGKFQEQHQAYRRTGERCSKVGCKGTIKRIIVGGRSTHYCEEHQL